MASKFEEFQGIVETQENEDVLRPYAKHSFEPFSEKFIDGEPIEEYYQREFAENSRPLDNRTPLQRERDRIVHSPEFRKLAEKYHVLYFENQKITRNYVTHVMRMAQVTRAICRGLKLNQDFAEALVIGCKIGSIPFPHVSQTTVHNWAKDIVDELDEPQLDNKGMYLPDGGSAVFPDWVENRTPEAKSSLMETIPVSKMVKGADTIFSTGKQSYRLLTLNPYKNSPTTSKWQKETVFGIWRHSLVDSMIEESRILFEFEMVGENWKHDFSWKHDTFEAMIVRAADDVTWVIENLQDANQARLLSGGPRGQSLFSDVVMDADIGAKLPKDVKLALSDANPAALYDFFIRDIVAHSEARFSEIGPDDLLQRMAIQNGGFGTPVGLSSTGFQALNLLKGFLGKEVFGDPRTENRNQVLETIIEFVANLLYGDHKLSTLPDITRRMIEERSLRHPRFRSEDIITLAENDRYFRIQCVINIMSEMSDVEVFNLVGMGTI